MRIHAELISFWTIVRKELSRIFRIWMQTLLPTVITTMLYFLIFGQIIGQRIGDMAGHSYLDFIAPGLIIFSVITNSYASAVSSFYGAKFTHSIEEVLVSPVSNIFILLGFISGGLMRGLISAVLVTIVAAFFTHLSFSSITLSVAVVILTALIFSTAGVINAVYAKSFDDISIVPNFVLTPLTYLGGVFYSVSLLHGIWYQLALLNPIMYIVSSFRHAVLGSADHHLTSGLMVLVGLFIVLFLIALHLFKKSSGLRQ